MTDKYKEIKEKYYDKDNLFKLDEEIKKKEIEKLKYQASFNVLDKQKINKKLKNLKLIIKSNKDKNKLKSKINKLNKEILQLKNKINLIIKNKEKKN